MKTLFAALILAVSLAACPEGPKGAQGVTGAPFIFADLSGEAWLDSTGALVMPLFHPDIEPILIQRGR